MTADGAAAFRAAAAALNEAADNTLRKETYRRFREAAKPLGAKVIAEGSGKMPARGGLRSRIAASKMGQSNATTGRNPGVALKFRTAPGAAGQTYDLKGIDDGGAVRHPTFGRRGKGQWRVTRVPRHAFTTPFEAGQPAVEQQILGVLNDIAATVAHSTTKGS